MNTNAFASEYHNRTVPAGDLAVRADLYERRHYDPNDIEAQAVRAGEPHVWRPFPVLETADGLRLVDGASLITAIIELDPATLVQVEIVSVEQALRIRSQNNAVACRREPMARARRARILHAAGYTNAQIAQELRVTPEDGMSDARIAQLRGAAEAEELHGSLLKIMDRPAAVPVRFWEAMKRTTDDLKALDHRQPKQTERSRSQMFVERVAELVAASKTMDHTRVEQKLKLHGRREGAPRARHIGEETSIPGTDKCMWLARNRKGGVIANYPQELSEAEEEEVLAAAVIKTSEVLARRSGKPG